MFSLHGADGVWLYDTKTGIPTKYPDRRPASYWFKTERTASGQMGLFAEEERDDLPLVNELRADVKRWRESGWENASEVTKTLLRHWWRDLRIAKGLTLRQCSERLGVDPSNWSKLERGINPAPKDIAILEEWAKFFALKGEAKQAFFDAAALSRSEIPADLASDERVMAALPAFFRAARGAELDEAQLRQFVEDMRALHRPDPKAHACHR